MKWAGRTRFAMVSLALLCALSHPARAQPAPPAVPDIQDETIDGARDWSQRMTVPVGIGGRGPYHFVVDTGAERTVISRELASELNLGRGPIAMVHSMTEVSEIGTVVIPGLQVGRQRVDGINAPALERRNLGAAGMLGTDALRSQRVVFDFARQRLTITPASRRDLSLRQGIAIRGREYQGRLMLFYASVDGRDVVIIVDTGSQVTVANMALRRALAARGQLGATAPVELRSITGGSMMADYAMVRRLRIGEISLNNLPISFADVHPFRQMGLIDRPALLLGMDVLQLFPRVAIDLSRRQIRLQLPGTGSMSSIDVRSIDPGASRLIQ
jgi:predicted aspartyl protease